MAISLASLPPSLPPSLHPSLSRSIFCRRMSSFSWGGSFAYEYKSKCFSSGLTVTNQTELISSVCRDCTQECVDTQCVRMILALRQGFWPLLCPAHCCDLQTLVSFSVIAVSHIIFSQAYKRQTIVPTPFLIWINHH